MSDEQLFTITVEHPDGRQIKYRAYSFDTLGPAPDRNSYGYTFRVHAKNTPGGLPPQGPASPSKIIEPPQLDDVSSKQQRELSDYYDMVDDACSKGNIGPIGPVGPPYKG